MLDEVELGRDRYERRAWSEAYCALSSADRSTPLSAADLERLATAAFLTGRDLEFQELLERLHRGYFEADDLQRAARCAGWLSLGLLLRGEFGQSNAWIARGQRLVEGRDCVEQGYLLLPRGEMELREGRAEAAFKTSTDAVTIGRRFREADLTAAASQGQGRALIEQGDIAAGLRCLDETMLSVVEGELSPIMTGLMYCSVLDACQHVYAFGRAREWTSAFSKVCEREPESVAFTGACLVHRAEIMQFDGAWPDALAEACLACERSERLRRRPPGAARYRQAEIHRLRGEFTKAEEAYRAASQAGFEPQPGLALLRLAQGRNEAACAAIERLASGASDRLQRAALLPAYLEIMLAVGRTPEAREACAELHAIAELFESDVLRASAAQSKGALALAEAGARTALGPLRAAFQSWERLGAPYESARVRVLIGLACRTLGDEDAGALELAAARNIFERLGARPDLTRLDSICADRAPGRTHPLTARELDVLRLIAIGNTNKSIAATLSVSERTVDRHVSNILDKLNVPSRAAATAYAYDHKIL
jgi:DNA-binding CsgD family transcriptional regulator/tetratricopeptide (TPR) repeat protein